MYFFIAWLFEYNEILIIVVSNPWWKTDWASEKIQFFGWWLEHHNYKHQCLNNWWFIYFQSSRLWLEPSLTLPAKTKIGSRVIFTCLSPDGQQIDEIAWLNSTGGVVAMTPDSSSLMLEFAPISQSEDGEEYRCIMTDGISKQLTIQTQRKLTRNEIHVRYVFLSFVSLRDNLWQKHCRVNHLTCNIGT